MSKPLDLFHVSILLERSEALAVLALEAEHSLSLERWKATLHDLADKHLDALQALDATQNQTPSIDLSNLRQQLWLLENKGHLAKFMKDSLTVQQCIALVADQLDDIDAARKQIQNLNRRAAA